ncbi:hypothetical protein ACFQ51_25905 [Streptomyces kaempferi]
MRTTRLTAAMVAAAVVSGTLALASPASADPTPAGTFRQLVGVGSDTTQDVLNALAGDTVNGKSYAGTAVKAGDAGLASYDAFVPDAATSTIQTRPGGPAFLRPNGSGPGRAALSMSLTGDKFPSSTGVAIKGQVDFARSSGGPSTSGTTLTYIPFARDAVGVAVRGSALDTLTVDQLHDIYTSGDTRLKVLNGQTLHAVLPQALRHPQVLPVGDRPHRDHGLLGDPDRPGEPGQRRAHPGRRARPVLRGQLDRPEQRHRPRLQQDRGRRRAHLASVQLPGDTGATSPVTTVNGKLTPVSGYFENATFGRDVYNVVPSRAIDPAASSSTRRCTTSSSPAAPTRRPSPPTPPRRSSPTSAS